MTSSNGYPIGSPGRAWGATERAEWLAKQVKKRSYADDVLSQVERFRADFQVDHYGTLNYGEFGDFPLFAVRSRQWQDERPTAVVTGGVHGYETSGVHGALRFIETALQQFSTSFNIVVIPCVSPWGYETINRWNPKAVDPNRSFKVASEADESKLLMAYMSSLSVEVMVHVDLHETTDTDNSEFRPALAARDNIEQKAWDIPDGFYLVDNAEQPKPEFQRAVLDQVEQVTHIAPADADGKLIGTPMQQFGVIEYAGKKLGLCMGLTDAPYVSTTEVYPDSEQTNPEECILAQVAAVVGALDYVQAKLERRQAAGL